MNTSRYSKLKHELSDFLARKGLSSQYEVHMTKTHGRFFKISVSIKTATERIAYTWEMHMTTQKATMEKFKFMEEKMWETHLTSISSQELEKYLREHYNQVFK